MTVLRRNAEVRSLKGVRWERRGLGESSKATKAANLAPASPIAAHQSRPAAFGARGGRHWAGRASARPPALCRPHQAARMRTARRLRAPTNRRPLKCQTLCVQRYKYKYKFIKLPSPGRTRPLIREPRMIGDMQIIAHIDISQPSPSPSPAAAVGPGDSASVRESHKVLLLLIIMHLNSRTRMENRGRSRGRRRRRRRGTSEGTTEGQRPTTTG